MIIDLAAANDASKKCVGTSMLNASVARFTRFRQPGKDIKAGYVKDGSSNKRREESFKFMIVISPCRPSINLCIFPSRRCGGGEGER